MKVLRWLAKNIGAILTAFILAVIVWVSAVVASDPNEEQILNRPIPIEVIGQDPSQQIMGNVARNLTLVLRAPASVWNQLNNDTQTVRSWVDLTNLGPGTHNVPVQIQITPPLVRIVSQDPQQLSITLDTIITQDFPVNLIVRGNPPVGYQVQPAQLTPTQVSVTGPESIVSKVSEVRVSLDITNANQSVVKDEAPIILDAQGTVLTGLTVSPDSITISQPIALLGGYRYVIVRAISQGQVVSGYRVTNIFVSPVGVVVFSSNPSLVDNLPGYVEAQPIDLAGKTDDFETLVDLNLPTGVTVVGDPKVLVQVSIAAIDSSLAISLPVEVIGLAPGLTATSNPPIMNVVLAGPVPILNKLSPADVRVVVDLNGYTAGTYQIAPTVTILPDQVQQVSMQPSMVEITITETPTPNQTPSLTTTPARTATPTPN
ncbi:MAG TPA: CdaR family protein [Anaerolineales bacterium]|nr:CdaR family protein [Anaerolineales bacterium]